VLEGVLGDELPAPRAAEDALGHVDALGDRGRGERLAAVALLGDRLAPAVGVGGGAAAQANEAGR
jgi:hypothetical protein